MRQIKHSKIVDTVYNAIKDITFKLDDFAVQSFGQALNSESNDMAKYVLSELLENAHIAKKDKIPLCQDTGMIVVIAEIGINIQLEKTLQASIDEAVAMLCEENILRRSVVKHPFDRRNTQNNTPSVLHIQQKEGNELVLNIMLKGFGSENMSFTKMFTPSMEIHEIANELSKIIIENACNACPPLFIGIGIGGTMDYAAFLSKKALFMNNDNNNDNYHDNNKQIVDKQNSISQNNSNNTFYYDEKLANMILKEVNNSGIGPAGYGGATTAISVNVQSYATHIAALPVAVTIQCHSLRHAKVVL